MLSPIVFIRTREPKRGTLRLHFDVNATDRDQDDELERLLAAGARRVDIGQPADASWHVLADPEGNYGVLCVAEGPAPNS